MMRSIAHKTTTHRKAIAATSVWMAAPFLNMVKEGTGPKGNIIDVARSAGIMAVKRTWELIPYCHPVPIDHVAVDFQFDTDHVNIEVSVVAVAKTGVEMEAILAAQVVATTIYDMIKPVTTQVQIGLTQLVEKRGGKSSFAEHLWEEFSAAVIVTSDGTAAGKRVDRSGRLIEERLARYGIAHIDYRIVPDEKKQIIDLVRHYVANKIDLIITTGGTGLGPRDVTVDAVQSLIDREIPGIVEAARAHGQQRTPYAMLSRGVAGNIGSTLIVTLPGSSNGVRESLDAIFPAILHAYPMMNGGGH